MGPAALAPCFDSKGEDGGSVHRAVGAVPDHARQGRAAPGLERLEADEQPMVRIIRSRRLRHQLVDMAIDQDDGGIDLLECLVEG